MPSCSCLLFSSLSHEFLLFQKPLLKRWVFLGEEQSICSDNIQEGQASEAGSGGLEGQAGFRGQGM